MRPRIKWYLSIERGKDWVHPTRNDRQFKLPDWLGAWLYVRASRLTNGTQFELGHWSVRVVPVTRLG